MATQKGLCPHCQNKRFDRRVFMDNPEASTCFCPTCMKEVEPKVAIEGYRNHIQKMLATADNTLFVTCDPTLAYQQYADVIELEPKEARALLGRILCLVYMGRVRKSYLAEAQTLLENTPYEGVKVDDYVLFLKKINFALDEYDDVLKKKLTFKDHYYDLDCLKLYWSHLYQIIKFKQLVLSIMKDIKQKYTSRQNDVLINMLDHNIDDRIRILNSKAYLVDGHAYEYERIYLTNVFVKEVKGQKDNHFARYRLCSLKEKDEGKRYIKDEVFKDYTKVVHAKKVSIVISLFLYALMGGFIAATLIFKSNITYFISFIASAAVLFIAATILFSLHLSWRAILKKRKLRID